MGTQRVVAQVDDLQDGQMKAIELDEERTILLVRVEGEFYALGHTCPHFGAPLADGLLEGRRIICPWHQSVFDVDSGDYIEPPTLESLPKYEVRVEGNDVIVVLPDGKLPSARLPKMASRGGSDQTFAILGAGAAGYFAAQAMREAGFDGRIALVTRETVPPYDRTELSKQYLASPDAPEPFLRDEPFLRKWGIDLLSGHEVTEVDPAGHAVVFGNGELLHYSRLLLATGATPRRLDVPGDRLGHVLLLRTYEDCQHLRGQAKEGARAVIVGASFIAMEVAASLTGRGVAVTVVAPENYPFELTMGEPVGRMYEQLHREKGVEFRMGAKVARFEGDQAVHAVVLEDGARLEADFVVVGIGVEPVTDYLRGVNLVEDNAVPVDAHLRVRGQEDLWAAGDIAQWPDWRRDGEPIRIEHWRLAQQLGHSAGLDIAGVETEFRRVPFFWTNQYKVSTRYVGMAREWDEIVVEGSREKRRFVAMYVRDGKMVAAAGVRRDRQMCMLGEMIQAERLPSVDRARAAIRSM